MLIRSVLLRRTYSLKEMFEIAVNLIQSKENHNVCFFCPYNARRRRHVSLNKGLICIEINLALLFLFSFSIQGTKDVSRTADLTTLTHQHLGLLISSQSLNNGARRGITDDFAPWAAYGTSLNALVCSWLSHGVAI